MQIDFYVLPSTASEAREHFCCRLAEKAWRASWSTVILTDNRPAAARLDEILWTFRQDSFVPHALFSGKVPDEEPVVIAWENPPPARDMMINITNRMPENWQAYQRLAEIVIQTDEVVIPARERYRHYRDADTTPKYHKLD